MTSFGNIRRYLPTTASKPCFTLYVIHLVDSFGCSGPIFYVLVRVYSAEWALVCYVYIYIILSMPNSLNKRLIDLRRRFLTSMTTLAVSRWPLSYYRNVFFTIFTIKCSNNKRLYWRGGSAILKLSDTDTFYFSVTFKRRQTSSGSCGCTTFTLANVPKSHF